MNEQRNTVKLTKTQLTERIAEALEALSAGDLTEKGIRSKVAQITQLRMTPAFHDAYNVAFEKYK